jgi:peroxiredoxin
LVGKALPALSGIKTDFSLQLARGNAVLFCFFDYEQRPSRNCIMQLAKRAEELKRKGATLVAIQASKIDENTLNEWAKKYKIPFAVGMIQGNEEKTKFNWGVKSLPWLILTDKEHVVTAEGFSVNKLNEKIEH